MQDGNVEELNSWAPKLFQAIQLLHIPVLQCVLELGAGGAAAHVQILGRLQEERSALHLRQLLLQPSDDLERRGVALVARVSA